MAATTSAAAESDDDQRKRLPPTPSHSSTRGTWIAESAGLGASTDAGISGAGSSALQFAGDSFFVETQAGVLDDEAPGEDAARELVELSRFNGFQESRRDFEFFGDLSQFEIALQAFAAQGLANGGHTGGLPPFEPIIQQGLNEAGVCLALLA